MSIRRASRNDDDETLAIWSHQAAPILNMEIIRHRTSGHPVAVDKEEAHSRNIQMLPTDASEYYSHQLLPWGWTPTIKTLFQGIRGSESSPLAALRPHEPTLLRDIHSYLSHPFAKHVRLTVPAALVGRTPPYDGCLLMQFNHSRSRPECYDRTILPDTATPQGMVAFSKCGRVNFPEPQDRNVNMMPFRFGDIDSLPDDLQCYHALIEQCPYMKDDIGKVGFLTVHESFVDAEKAQRREGLHIESPGVNFGGNGDSFNNPTCLFTPALEHQWGTGMFMGPDCYDGGIFMASSGHHTSQIWDALVDKNVPGIVDKHGGCEHLRGIIGPGTKLLEGDLVWMTDCTPHEALPQTTSGYRQFFRVVTPYVSHWFADHSTPNPKVPLPDHIQVIHGSKFDEDENIGLVPSLRGRAGKKRRSNKAGVV